MRFLCGAGWLRSRCPSRLRLITTECPHNSEPMRRSRALAPVRRKSNQRSASCPFDGFYAGHRQNFDHRSKSEGIHEGAPHGRPPGAIGGTRPDSPSGKPRARYRYERRCLCLSSVVRGVWLFLPAYPFQQELGLRIGIVRVIRIGIGIANTAGSHVCPQAQLSQCGRMRVSMWSVRIIAYTMGRRSGCAGK